jgi:predicted RNA-binding Zn ribbon-like protein
MDTKMNFEFIGGNLALDFANTVHSFLLRDPQDDLKTPADLIDWGVQAGLIKEHECSRLLRKTDIADLRRARELRKIVYYLFARVAQTGRPEHVTLIRFDRLLRDAMARASIQKSGQRYELGCSPDTSPLDRLHFAVIRAALELVTSGKLGRVRQCQGDTCSWLFLDTSRNGMRRWCDMQACGNRAKVRRFRQHQS